MLLINGMPILSVIIACYNMGVYIDETVESVLAQTFGDYEIIIVDDGSDDPGTISKLNVLSGRGFTVLKTENCGVAAARNSGIKLARGRYILTLDADDLIAPSYLEKAVRVLEENPDTGIVSCDAELFGDASGVRTFPDFSMERLLSENILLATSVFRKSDWQAVGGYRTVMKFGWEDWDFWIAMARLRIQIVRIPETLFKYRIRTCSRDRSMDFWQKLSMLLLIIARHFICYLRSPICLIKLVTNAKSIN